MWVFLGRFLVRTRVIMITDDSIIRISQQFAFSQRQTFIGSLSSCTAVIQLSPNSKIRKSDNLSNSSCACGRMTLYQVVYCFQIICTFRYDIFEYIVYIFDIYELFTSNQCYCGKPCEQWPYRRPHQFLEKYLILDSLSFHDYEDLQFLDF